MHALHCFQIICKIYLILSDEDKRSVYDDTGTVDDDDDDLAPDRDWNEYWRLLFPQVTIEVVYMCVSVYSCVCICVFMYLCLCTCVCVSVYSYMCVCVLMCLYLCTRVSMPVYLCMCVCVLVYVRLCTHLSVSVYSCIYACVLVYVCLCIHVCVSMYACVHRHTHTLYHYYCSLIYLHVHLCLNQCCVVFSKKMVLFLYRHHINLISTVSTGSSCGNIIVQLCLYFKKDNFAFLILTLAQKYMYTIQKYNNMIHYPCRWYR